MAKFVEFSGKKIGIPDKNFKIIDSSKNVKKAALHYKSLLDKFDTADDEADSINQLSKNIPMMAEEIAATIADFADLNDKQKAGLEDQSYSDQYEIFNKFLWIFLGFSLPSDEDVEADEVDTDPKLEDEN